MDRSDSLPPCHIYHTIPSTQKVIGDIVQPFKVDITARHDLSYLKVRMPSLPPPGLPQCSSFRSQRFRVSIPEARLARRQQR